MVMRQHSVVEATAVDFMADPTAAGGGVNQ